MIIAYQNLVDVVFPADLEIRLFEMRQPTCLETCGIKVRGSRIERRRRRVSAVAVGASWRCTFLLDVKGKHYWSFNSGRERGVNQIAVM
jgi:hypothetical protein